MDQAEYYETHPPRCLAAFIAALGDFEKGEFDGHGPGHINTTFRLSCSCGSDRHVIHLYAWNNPDEPDQTIILSPLTAECVACRKKSLVFDSDIHGYNPEVGIGSVNRRAEGTTDRLECSQCDMSTEYQVFVRFEYPDDLFSEDFAEFEGRQQDLFTWFSMVAKCSKCNGAYDVASIECA